MQERQDKIKYLLILFIVYQGMSFFITPLLASYLFKSTSYFTMLFVQMVSFCIPIVVVLVLSSRDTTKSEQENLFDIAGLYKNKIKITTICVCVLVACLLSIGVHYLSSFFEVSIVLITGDVGVVSVLPDTNFGVVLGAILAICILPSIFEELLFRGMYHDALKQSKIKWQFVIPTTVFALSHGSVFSVVSAVSVSIVLIFIMIKRNSLIECTIVHFVYNLCAVILSNVTTLPLSTLRLLEAYATNKVFLGSLFVYASAIAIIFAILLLILSVLSKNNSKIDNSKATVIHFVSAEKKMLYALIAISAIMYAIRMLI